MNGRRRSPPSEFARQLGELAHDAVTLSELQGRLLLVDARKCGRTIRLPLSLVAVGLLLGLAAFPVLILSGSYLLADTTPLPLSASLAICAAVALLIGGAASGAGVLLVRRSLAAFERSQREFQRNVDWVKQVLRQRRSGARRTEFSPSLPIHPYREQPHDAGSP